MPATLVAQTDGGSAGILNIDQALHGVPCTTTSTRACYLHRGVHEGCAGSTIEVSAPNLMALTTCRR